MGISTAVQFPTQRSKRIGLIGFGYIGSNLYQCFQQSQGLIETAFVYNRSEQKLNHVPRDLVVQDLNQIDQFEADIIVEIAHPDITRQYGEYFLEMANYLPLSVTALADEGLLNTLLETAKSSSHQLLIPHGALVGIEGLLELKDRWREVSITFRKPPSSIDLSLSRYQAIDIAEETIIYDGSVRGIAHLFPRNVNTMVTCALATVGLDKCRALLIADPTLDQLIADIEAWGKDGSYLHIQKMVPAMGVSGSEMFEAVYRSILVAAGLFQPLDFV